MDAFKYIRIAIWLLILLVWASCCSAAQYVGGTYCNTGAPTSSRTCGFATPPAAGDTLLVFCAQSNANANLSVTDNLSNAYTRDIAQSTATASGAWFRLSDIPNGITFVTCSGVRGSWAMIALEYSGLDSINPVDVSVGATGASPNPIAGALTTTNALDLIVSAFASDSASSTSVLPTENFTIRWGDGRGDLDHVTAAQDSFVSSPGSYASAFSYPVRSNWVALSVAYKLAAAAGPGSLNPVAFPVKVSNTNTYLVDQNDGPFLIIGDAPQALIGISPRRRHRPILPTDESTDSIRCGSTFYAPVTPPVTRTAQPMMAYLPLLAEAIHPAMICLLPTRHILPA
jgi:hypothetical protein